MPLFTIDEKACTRCGICVLACPLKLFVPDDSGLPSPRQGKEDACIACGHCAAACPADAIALAAMPSGFAPIERGRLPAFEEAAHFMRSRRSVRAYKEESLPREVIAEVLDVTRWAPTGHNTQDVEWLVLDGRAAVVRLGEAVIAWAREAVAGNHPMAGPLHLDGIVRAWDNGKDIVFRGAPHLVLAHTGPAAVSGAMDGVIAAAWAELAAHARGLGACWAGYLLMTLAAHPLLARELGLPEERIVRAGLMLGRPRFRYSRIPPRKPLRIAYR